MKALESIELKFGHFSDFYIFRRRKRHVKSKKVKDSDSLKFKPIRKNNDSQRLKKHIFSQNFAIPNYKP